MPSSISILRSLALWCLLLMATETLQAKENVPALKLAINGKSVDVFDMNRRMIQSLPFSGEEPDEHNRNYFVVVQDMNFDGFPDVAVLFSAGMVNHYYDCWLWRPDENAFILHEDMRELASPVFDHDSKTVHVYERGSVTTFVEGFLAWENGELVWQSQTVQDEDPENDCLVIRRYRREDGELRLIEEKRRILDREHGSWLGNTCLSLELSGLNLIADREAEPLDSILLPNGEWWLRQRLGDGAASLESRRLPDEGGGEETVRRLILREWPLAREISVASFPELAEKTSYPVLKAEFLDGVNEDTQQIIGALIFADEWSFWFVVQAQVDTVLSFKNSGEEPASAQNSRLKNNMEAILLRIEAVDPFEGGFLPGFVPPVYLSAPDSTLSISIMDALIRIKKIINPDSSPLAGTGPFAYRYDGSGTVADKPVLLFSFGTDSREKFTAKRHFAIDAKSMVYEMDALSGDEYRQWDERGIVRRGE